MASAEMLKALVSQRLVAAAADIVDLFCVKLQEYEQEVCRQRRELNALVSSIPPHGQGDAGNEIEVGSPRSVPQEEPEQGGLQGPEEGFITASGSGNKEEPQSPPSQQNPAEGSTNAKQMEEKDDAGDGAEIKTESSNCLEQETEDSSDYSDTETEYIFYPTKSSKKSFRCSWCRKKFSNNSNLKRHMNLHCTQKPFSCSVCSRSFAQNSQLKNHMARHSKGRKKYKKRLPQRSEMKTQMQKGGSQSSQLHQNQTVEDKEAAPLATDEGEEDDDDGGLGVVHDKMPYSPAQETDDSDDWGEMKKPPSGANVLLSVDSHFDEMECEREGPSENPSTSNQGQTSGKSFPCTVCGKTYKKMMSLKVHMRIHSEVKRPTCPVCHKIFLSQAHLTKHKKSHPEEQPVFCPVCNKKCRNAAFLTRHTTYHTRERRFVCKICDATFLHSSNLYVHRKIHHTVN